jgi:hypothetical protein
MKWKKHRLLLYVALPVLLPGINVHALETLIDVRLDTADILIGEQTTLHLTITVDDGKTVYWPVPADLLMPGVEVLSLSQPDSTVIDNRIIIKQDILITSFDSLLYLLPPFMAIDRTDTVYSNQVALKVSTVPVNVDAPEEFFDVKDIWKPPFVPADYYPLIFGILIALVVLFLIWYVVKRLRSKKSLMPFRKTEPELPPDQIAVRELDKIKQQKLWQHGRNKEYYTQITDTLRHYMWRRYGFNAMEMTSYEILEILHEKNDDRAIYDMLKQILRLADFVKFAKLHPLPDENDLSMANAYQFVSRTKPAEVAQPETEARQENETSDSNLNSTD